MRYLPLLVALILMAVRKGNQDDFSDFSAGVAMDGEDRATQDAKSEMRM